MEREAIRDKLIELCCKVLGFDHSKLNEDSIMADIPEWDSFNNLMIISEIEEHFKKVKHGFMITMADVEKINNFKDLIGVCKHHLEEI